VGYPQSYAINPLLPISWLLGAVVGAKVMVLAYAVFGTVGMYLLCVELGLRWEAAVAGAILFQFNGAIVQHLAEGHFAHQVNNWVPWSLLFFFRARYRWNWNLLVSGILLAAVLLSGEVYTLIFAAVALGFWCLFEAIRVRSLRPVAGLASWLTVA